MQIFCFIKLIYFICRYFVSDLKSLRFKVMAVLNNDHNKKCFIARHEKHQKDVLFQLTDEWFVMFILKKFFQHNQYCF